MRANEMDYLNGILEAADDVDEETKEIKIIRSGKLYFAFSVHALSDDDMYEIRKVHQIRKKQENWNESNGWNG